MSGVRCVVCQVEDAADEAQGEAAGSRRGQRARRVVQILPWRLHSMIFLFNSELVKNRIHPRGVKQKEQNPHTRNFDFLIRIHSL